MTEAFDDFEVDDRPAGPGGALVVDLEGYEGPIDMLLVLARQQKVDLLNISILELAEQYLAFIEEARRLRLEIAADYLVMAAWLAYLKSRLLLPADEEDEEPTGPEMAEALAFQLRRLEAMQQAGSKVMELPRLGRDVFPRGAPEGVKVIRTPVYDLSLYELLRAYGDHQSKGKAGPLEIAPTEIYSVDDALERLGRVLGKIPDWTTLEGFLPESIKDNVIYRSAISSTFVASLELAKSGELELRQSGTFGPIYVRSRAETG
ncbi:MAG: segregation/condensation protein A [Rhodospirillaceae bacterium]|nr:segregation/condensation protein A [Rhodospirillaceae bacterium]|tara:strand:+ start:25400 stop:26185 length:786 start_codon:yes stop_codon:yes gene_type:complete